MSLSKNWKKFYDVAIKTKNALYSQWKKEGCFVDKNNLSKSGVIPEGVGLTSILIMMVAFRDDEVIFPKNVKDGVTLEDCSALVNNSMKKLCDWTKTEFNASPILNKKCSEMFECDRGYLETVTWCLSPAILAVYAEKHGALKLEPTVRESTLDMMARAMEAFIKAQRSDGTWGFTTDGRGKKSLYFTYVANATLCDFFNYIMDEISIVENTGVEKEPEIDTQTLEYLDKRLGINTAEVMKGIRVKLNKFLVEKCLPILPKLASCNAVSQEELDIVGAELHFPIRMEKEAKYYHNLYYTYYLLDMMIANSADWYFDDIIKDTEAAQALLDSYSPYLLEHERKYYKTNFEDFFYNFYEQALHSSRMNYLTASRTGNKFWDVSTSELNVSWVHEDEDISDLALRSLDISKATVTDATILPMALRANVIYSYYLTKRPEITIERLFNDICKNAYIDSEENEDCVKDLWDSVYYNLMITERWLKKNKKALKQRQYAKALFGPRR